MVTVKVLYGKSLPCTFNMIYAFAMKLGVIIMLTFGKLFRKERVRYDHKKISHKMIIMNKWRVVGYLFRSRGGRVVLQVQQTLIDAQYMRYTKR